MADLDQSPPPTLANSASCAPAMPMAAPEQLVPKVLPPQTFYAPELEEVHTLVTSIVCAPEIRVEKVEITVPETKTLADCGSVPATRVAAELAIPDASTPTPAPDGLHPILAKALGKDSGFTPTVYLKNGNQYWVKVRP